MVRTLTFFSLLALGAAASAQQQIVPSSKVLPITGTVRDAGTYHLATGTWTRKASQADLGADTIYDNTCSWGYYSPLSTDTYVDEGRIPSSSGPTNLNARPGCSTQYTIDGFQIAYCTDQVSMGTYTVNLYETYVACASVIGVTPTAGFAITGLPASGTGATLCWIVTLDLDAPPQTASLAFPMPADGDGTYAGTSTANLFGWSMSSSLQALATATGPLFAGNFAICTGYDGTRWDPVVNYAEAGTGMNTLDQIRIEGGAVTAPGCYFFGSSPFSSFHLELYSDACGPQSAGTPFCFGDGTGVACPCGNDSVPGSGQGCLHSLGAGGKLLATGTASLSNDTVTLHGTLMPDASALYLQGTTQHGGDAGIVFGDGKRCAGGSTIRLKTVLNVGGASQYPQPGDPSISVKGLVTVPGTRTYQVWFRNAAAFCTSATFNLTNGIEVAWGL